MARVYGNDGTVLVQADVSSITLYVRDTMDPSTDIANSPYTLSVATVIFDTLLTDYPWEEDETGHNFRYDTLGEQLPEGDKTYRFEFACSLVSGAILPVVFHIPTLNLFNN